MLTDPQAIRRFVTAGRATFTLSSKRTGARYTYRASAVAPGGDRLAPTNRFFLSLLTGPDNESNFTYLGLIEHDAFRLTAKSRLGEDTAPVRAARFFCRRVLQDGVVPDELEVRHEGRCGRCNRKLTVPSSIDSGVGPECAKFV
jgi:hypothetical protein